MCKGENKLCGGGSSVSARVLGAKERKEQRRMACVLFFLSPFLFLGVSVCRAAERETEGKKEKKRKHKCGGVGAVWAYGMILCEK